MEQVEADERRATPGRNVSFVREERGGANQRQAEAEQGPGWPTKLASLDQRHDQQRQCGCCQHHASEVQRPVPLVLVRWQDGQRGDDRQHAQRNVDQERRPPAETEHVERQEHAAEHLAGDGRNAGY